MKKWIALILTVSIVFFSPITSLAEGETITQDSQANSGNITVGYNAGVTYTVTIPASVTFSDAEKEVERPLQVSNVLLNEGSTLHINLSSLNEFKMVCGGGYIDYRLTINNNEPPGENNYTILTVSAGENTGWALLNFVTDLQKDHAMYAGNYTDTLTFTVEVQ